MNKLLYNNLSTFCRHNGILMKEYIKSEKESTLDHRLYEDRYIYIYKQVSNIIINYDLPP